MKRIGKALAIGLCVGVGSAVLQSVLPIEREVFMRGFWIAIVSVTVIAIGFQVGYQLYYQKKIRAVAALREEGDINGYITGMEALLEKAKSKYIQSIVRIDLSAGYFDTEEYGRAIELLEGTDEKQIAGTLARAIYRQNLCMNYFYAGQGEKGLKLFEESEKLFAQYRNLKQANGAFEYVYILAAIQRGQFEQAKALLDQTRNTWQAPRTQQSCQRIELILKNAQARAAHTPSAPQ